MPLFWNEDLITSAAALSASALLLMVVEEQAAINAATQAAASTLCVVFFMSCSLAFDGRGDALGAFGIHTHVNTQRHRGVAAVFGLGKALLSIAVVQALLHGPHLTVAHTIGWPCRKPNAIARVLG